MGKSARYDVFISYKHSNGKGALTIDAEAARQTYELLTANGIETFYGGESIAAEGQGRYSRAIEGALESARVLVLVASSREHIDAPFVEAEWDSFLNDLRTGRKDGELVLFNCGALEPSDLPLFLRRQNMYSDQDDLVEFVKNALPRATRLGDIVKASLHRHVPSENMDRVYLVTVHSPTGDSFVITGHWGGRKAKALRSMTYHTGVESRDEARRLVAKLVKKKLAEGYSKASLRSLLSADARRALTASLGIQASG